MVWALVSSLASSCGLLEVVQRRTTSHQRTLSTGRSSLLSGDTNSAVISLQLHLLTFVFLYRTLINKSKLFSNCFLDSRILKDVHHGQGGLLKPRKDTDARSDSAVSPGKKNKRRMVESWVIPTKEKEKEKVEGKPCEKNSAPATVIKEEKEAPLSAVKMEKEEVTEKEVVEEKDPLEVIREKTGIVVLSGQGFESRWSKTVLEEENFQPDCASLNLVQECQDNLGKRAVVVSTIFRNLSFVPGNETILSSSPGFLAVCGKMLLHHHWHPPRTSKQRNYDRGEEEDFTESCTSLSDQAEWWWEHLQVSNLTVYMEDIFVCHNLVL